jgi:hypothetical protein
VTSILSELGLVLISWIGTGSLWNLSGPIAALGRRSKFNGRPIRMIYVDNPFHVGLALRMALPQLGGGLHPDDSGIRHDTYHLRALFYETIRPNHPQIKGEFRCHC